MARTLPRGEPPLVSVEAFFVAAALFAENLVSAVGSLPENSAVATLHALPDAVVL
jgi:hypothetical protein